MNLQFADFDADGDEDIITATFEGTVFVVHGSDKGWQPPVHVKDHEDRNVVLSLYYDMESNNYANADRSPDGHENPNDHCVSAIVWDWDADGDLDLLLGAKEGRLYLQRNEGTKTEPAFTGVNELLQAGGREFNVPGGLTAPVLVDWDADGKTDLLCGSFKGGAYWYRNVGSKTKPKFNAPIAIAMPGKGDGPKDDWYVKPVDYDNDGDLDLLVGGQRRVEPPPRKLNEEEKARLAEVDAELEVVQKKMQKLFEEVEKKAANEPGKASELFKTIYDTEEFKTVSKRSSELRREQGKLRPRAKRVGGVWLLRRTDPAAAPGGAKDD